MGWAERLHGEGERPEGDEGGQPLRNSQGVRDWGEGGRCRCKGSQSRRLPGELQGQWEAVRLEQSLGERAEALRAAGPGHAGSVHSGMNSERMQFPGGLRGRHAMC